MRELKFRVFNKTQKKMINMDDWFFHEDSGPFFISTEDGRINFEITAQYDFELMQFTGLKDKNGKEIYEHDIVSCQERGCGASGPVKYYLGVLKIAEYRTQYCGFVFNDNDPHPLHSNVEIIGNIFENKEILE